MTVENDKLRHRNEDKNRELETLNIDEKILAQLDFSKIRKAMLKCLHSLSGIERKHIARTLISPETGGRVILDHLTTADFADEKMLRDGSVIPGEEIEGKTWVRIESQIKVEKIYAVLNYLKDKGYLNKADLLKLNLNSSKYSAWNDL